MCLTGAFLILFVTFHVLMNGVAIFWPTAYNMVCEFLGANWYALIGTGVLALGFILHIVYATWLTVQNRKARGHERYEVTSRPPQVEWSSKNMLVLGIVILAFLVLHLVQFWSKMQWAEITGHEVVDPVTGAVVPAAAGTWFLQMAFSNGIFLAAYLIGFIALIAALNALFATVTGWFGYSISFQGILGYIFYPIAWVMGVPSSEALQVGSIMATKLVSNEFVAMMDLQKIASTLSPRAEGILSVFLVSFANFSSIGIIAGAIKGLNEEQGNVVSRFGLKLVYGSTLVSVLSASIAALVL